MSRFDKYRTESDLPVLKKLEPGESFTAKLLGDHDYTGDSGPIPVLEFRDDGGEFGWLAGAWKAREELAIADPKVGDVVTVARLADRGRSHDYSIVVVQPASEATPSRRGREGMTMTSRGEDGGECSSCGIVHPPDDEHCPNCGQPASILFHASWNLEKCPYWLNGRWVLRADFTPADEAELARQREDAA